MNPDPEQEQPQQAQKALPHKPDAVVDQNTTNSPLLKRPIIMGDLTLASPTTFTTIGSNGAATALTANPVGYVVVMIGNTAYQIPFFNLA